MLRTNAECGTFSITFGDEMSTFQEYEGFKSSTLLVIHINWSTIIPLAFPVICRFAKSFYFFPALYYSAKIVPRAFN